MDHEECKDVNGASYSSGRVLLATANAMYTELSLKKALCNEPNMH